MESVLWPNEKVNGMHAKLQAKGVIKCRMEIGFNGGAINRNQKFDQEFTLLQCIYISHRVIVIIHRNRRNCRSEKRRERRKWRKGCTHCGRKVYFDNFYSMLGQTTAMTTHKMGRGYFMFIVLCAHSSRFRDTLYTALSSWANKNINLALNAIIARIPDPPE